MIDWIKNNFFKPVRSRYFIRFGTEFTTIMDENNEIILKRASEIKVKGQNCYPISCDEIVLCDEAILMFKQFNSELKKMSHVLKGSEIYISASPYSAEVEILALAYVLRIAKPHNVSFVCESHSAFTYLNQNTGIESMLIIDINCDCVKISIVNQYEIIYVKELGLRDCEETDNLRKMFQKREYESSISRVNEELREKGYTYQKAFIIGSNEMLVNKYKNLIINILQIDCEIPENFSDVIALGIGLVYKNHPNLFRMINLN